MKMQQVTNLAVNIRGKTTKKYTFCSSMQGLGCRQYRQMPRVASIQGAPQMGDEKI